MIILSQWSHFMLSGTNSRYLLLGILRTFICLVVLFCSIVSLRKWYERLLYTFWVLRGGGNGIGSISLASRCLCLPRKINISYHFISINFITFNVLLTSRPKVIHTLGWTERPQNLDEGQETLELSWL